MSLNDLNFDPPVFCHSLSRSISKEKGIEPRTNRVCSTHQFLFSQRVQSLRLAIPRQQECALILLLGSVTGNVVRPTDLLREPSRHRSLASGTTRKAVPQRHRWPSETIHVGRCQREPRLENLFRACTLSISWSFKTRAFGQPASFPPLMTVRASNCILPKAVHLSS